MLARPALHGRLRLKLVWVSRVRHRRHIRRRRLQYRQRHHKSLVKTFVPKPRVDLVEAFVPTPSPVRAEAIVPMLGQ